VFTPADGTKLTLILDNTTIKDTMIGSAILGGTQSPFQPGIPQPDLGYNNNNNYDPVHSIRNRGASLRWDQGIGALSFSSTTAYRNARSVIGGDIDGLPQFYEQFYTDQLDQQFTQELQLNSDPHERLKWTAGLFYYDAKTGYEPFSVFLNDVGIYFGVPTVYETSRSEAGYVQGSYDIFDQTNLTLGVRYTNETRREYDAFNRIYPIGADPSTAIDTPIAPESVKFDKVTYRASLDHRFSDEVMAYVSFNTGFKSGGFNVPTPGTPAFLPETLKAYEAGVKLDLLDRRIRLNAATFYYDYKDIQVQKYVDVTIGTVNGGAAISWGFDADLTVLLAPGLQFTAGGTAADPHFTNFVGCARTTPTGGVPVVSGSCTGNMLNLASKGTASAALDYTFSIPTGEINLNANVYYNSGFYTESDNIIHQSGFTEFGAAARWTAPGEHFYVGAYGKNLSNKRVLTFGGTQAIGTQLVGYAAPRTYGITAGYKF
jgi:iron complex outermembrane receptor protein